MITSINIRPSVGMLTKWRFFPYEHSHALGEFVDNSIQSFVDNEEEIKSVDGADAKLNISIILDRLSDTLTIEDNAAGIDEENYERSFLTGEDPPDTDGLSEFGMGMKVAACWYASKWTVETTALGESTKRVVSWDMNQLSEEIPVDTFDIDPDKHYTKIILSDLHQKPWGAGYTKIQNYLASIYRLFIQDGQLQLHCLNRRLSFPDRPGILSVPHYSNLEGEPQEWKKNIRFDFQGMRVSGFAALRDRGTSWGTGFSLFRRNRLIREKYLHPEIFGRPNDQVYQRMFGELHIEGVGVSFAKDQFNWNDEEEGIFLEMLKRECEPLIDQAKNYRYRTPRSVPPPEPETPEPETPEPETPPSVNPEPPVDSETESHPENEQSVDSQPGDTDPINPDDESSVDDPAVLEERIARVTFQGERMEINLATPFVYFIELPVGGVIKIGETKSVSGLSNRKTEAQRYFEREVKVLGVIRFEVGENPRPKEQELLEQFGRVNTERHDCELVSDTSVVREYIAANCENADPYIEAAP